MPRTRHSTPAAVPGVRRHFFARLLGSRPRRERRQLAVLALGWTVIATTPAIGQDPSTDETRTAALLFAYTPAEGNQSRFDEGYRRHLDWHRAKGDSLVWYGWYVLTGDRIGTFIDGTFGNRFEAIDRRVDPAGDAADFAQTAAPFADPVYRRAYRLRVDLSSATPLEDRQPSPLVHVYHFTVEPGTGERFEEWVRQTWVSTVERGGGPDYTWYELVLGGEHPGYLLMVPARGLSGLQPISTEALAGMAARVRSETWRYREDLSYLPED